MYLSILFVWGLLNCFQKCIGHYLCTFMLFLLKSLAVSMRSLHYNQVCRSIKLFYKVSFIYVKTYRYLWSCSYCKDPLLWPLLHKKNLYLWVLPLNLPLILPGKSLLPKVIPLRLFLDIVSSSFAYVYSRIAWMFSWIIVCVASFQSEGKPPTLWGCLL